MLKNRNQLPTHTAARWGQSCPPLLETPPHLLESGSSSLQCPPLLPLRRLLCVAYHAWFELVNFLRRGQRMPAFRVDISERMMYLRNKWFQVEGGILRNKEREWWTVELALIATRGNGGWEAGVMNGRGARSRCLLLGRRNWVQYTGSKAWELGRYR